MALYKLKNAREATAPLQNYAGDNSWIRNQRASLGYETPTLASASTVTRGDIQKEKANNSQPSTLENLLAGIAKPFKDVGQTVVGMIGTGVASIKDLAEGTTGSATGYKNGTSEWVEGKNTDAFKKWLYGKDDIKDVYPEAAGTALNAAADLATLAIPAAAGAGSAATKAATSIGGNAIAGAVGGVGDELAQNGNDATLESVLKRAAVGGVTGAAVGGMNKGLNNALASGTTNRLLNNKLTNSAIGRGALSGAVGGAIGGGGTVAADGGDLGEIANAALSGAGTGAISGATTAAATKALTKAGTAARDKIWEAERNYANSKAGYNGTSIYSSEALENGYDDRNKLVKAINKYNDDVTAKGNLGSQITEISDDGSTLTLNDGRRVTTDSMLKKLNVNGVEQIGINNLDDTDETTTTKATNYENLDKWDKLAREGGYETYDDVVRGYMKDNPGVPKEKITAGAVLTWMDENPGDYNPNATKIAEPTKKIQKKNALQKIGSELQRDSQEIKNKGLLDSLDKKTAQRAIDTGAIDKLSKMGVDPQNYDDYAETSSYVNKAMSDLAKNSGVMVEAPELASEIAYDNLDVVLSDTAQKKYNGIIKQIVADGKSPSQYSASYLLEKSRELGTKAANLRGNTDDVKGLRAALTDAKYTLRNYANDALASNNVTGQSTTQQIASGLKKMGANQKVIDYYTSPNADGSEPTASDYISRSSLFEQARDMGSESAAEQYTRSASKMPQNVTSAVVRSSGVDIPAKTILSNTVAPVAGAVTNAAGKAIGKVGDALAGVSGTGATTTQTGNVPSLLMLNNIGRQVERNEAWANDGRASSNQITLESVMNPEAFGDTATGVDGTYATSTVDTPTNQTQYNTGNNATLTSANLNATQNQIQTWQTGLQMMDYLRTGMQNALNAGDLDAYKQIATIYDYAYDAYDMEGYQTALKNATTQSTTKLSQTQQRANAAAISLQQLANMQPDMGYNLSNIPLVGSIATLGGNEYESTAKSLATQIGYMLSGANISKTEAENIGKAYVPQPWDSEEMRQYKLNLAAQIIAQYQNSYAE